MADTKVSALSNLSVPALTDYAYAVLASGPTEKQVTFDRLLGTVAQVPGGRLTLTTATPVTSSDVTAASTLYYTPYNHDFIRVWDGTRWAWKQFSELTLTLSSLTSGKAYDVFYNGTALSLSSAWSSDTARTDALALQNNIAVLGSDHTKLHLGTIYTTGTTTTEDSLAKRYVWNRYNRVPRSLFVSEATSHTINNVTPPREWNNASAARAQFVTGSAEDAITQHICGAVTLANTGALGVAFVAIDTTTSSGYYIANKISSLSGFALSNTFAPVLGKHYITVYEFESNSFNLTMTSVNNAGSVMA